MNAYIRKKKISVIWLVAGFLVMFAMCIQPAHAGKLDDFEQEATEEDEDKDKEEGWLSFEDEEEEDDFGCFDLLFGSLKFIFNLFGDDDAEQSAGDSVRPAEREIGGYPEEQEEEEYQDLEFPVLVLDAAYQNVDSDVGAFDARIEAGLAFLAAQGRLTWYVEDEPSDDLGMYQFHGLLRLPLGDYFKIGVGAGMLIMDGRDQNSGFSTTVPILFSANELLGVEFRPTWSWINENRIDDFDASVLLMYEFAALRVGYRSVRSEHESLDGAYAGGSLRF